MSIIIATVILLGVAGGFAGVLLAMSSRVFAVKVDLQVAKIEEILPGIGAKVGVVRIAVAHGAITLTVELSPPRVRLRTGSDLGKQQCGAVLRQPDLHQGSQPARRSAVASARIPTRRFPVSESRRWIGQTRVET